MSIKSFFFKDKTEVEEPIVKVTEVAQGVGPVPNIAISNSPDESLEDYRSHFRNLPLTNSYGIFIKALGSLENTQLEERVKYLGAYAGISATGITKDEIVNDCVSMLQIIDTEMGDFTQEWSSKFTVEVEAKVKEIERHTYVIQELRDQILEAENKIKMLQSDKQHNEIALGIIKASFTKAGSEYKDQVTRVLDKIKSYL